MKAEGRTRPGSAGETGDLWGEDRTIVVTLFTSGSGLFLVRASLEQGRAHIEKAWLAHPRGKPVQALRASLVMLDREIEGERALYVRDHRNLDGTEWGAIGSFEALKARLERCLADADLGAIAPAPGEGAPRPH